MNKQELIQAVGSSQKVVDTVIRAMKLKETDFTDTHADRVKRVIQVMNEQSLTADQALEKIKTEAKLAKKGSAIAVDEATAIVDSQAMGYQLPEQATQKFRKTLEEQADKVVDDIPHVAADRFNQNQGQIIAGTIASVDDAFTNSVQKADGSKLSKDFLDLIEGGNSPA